MPESSPRKVDAKTHEVEPSDQCELAADDGDHLTPSAVENDETSCRKLEDRISGLEQRLWEAGLLKKPETQNDPKKTPEDKGDLKRPESPSSRNVSGSKNHADLIKGSPKDTDDQEDSVRALVDRIDSLERRLEEAGHLKGDVSLAKCRLPAIPQLQYVQWSDFKNKLVGKDQTYAIEVLTGEVKYWYQRSGEERNFKQTSVYQSNGRDKLPTATSRTAPLLERIRINSKPILLFMKKIDPTGWSDSPTVIIWPFKPLIYHEVRVREIFEGLQSKWGNADTEDIVPRRTRSDDDEDLTDSVEALRDLRCLVKFIDLELRPLTEYHSGDARKKILFRNLWHLFKPGDLIYCPLDNGDRFARDRTTEDRFQEVFRIDSTAGGRNNLSLGRDNDCAPISNINPFRITVYWVDFNAKRFVPQYTRLELLPFQGERDIASLVCYPLRYSAKADELRSKWRSRGEAFRDYTTFKYRYYTGKSLTSPPDGRCHDESEYPKHPDNIDSQVVVDFSEAFAAHPEWWSARNRDHWSASTPYYEECNEDYPILYWKNSDRIIMNKVTDDIYKDSLIDAKLTKEWKKRDPLLKEASWTTLTETGDFDTNYLILLPNRVFAFVMKSRKWCK